MPWYSQATTSGLGGLTGWGSPPDLRAAPIGDIADVIRKQRQYEQENVYRGISDLAAAIKQRQRDEMANKLMATAPAYGLPESPFVGGGEAGLKQYGTLVDAIREQQKQDLAERVGAAHAGAYERQGRGGTRGGAPRYMVDGVEVTGAKYLEEQRRRKAELEKQRAAQGYEAQLEKQINAAAIVKAGPPTPPRAADPFWGRKPASNEEWNQYKKEKADYEQAQRDLVKATTLLKKPQYISGEDTGGAGGASDLAPGYGVKGVKMRAPDGTISTVDPDKVEYYKSKGAVIVP
jgi:hypothetical protein